MSARNDLAKLLADDWNPDRDPILTAMFRDYAESILAAGWRAPTRKIETEEELEALPVGTVLVEGDHATPDEVVSLGLATMPGVFHRFPDGWHVVAGHGPRQVPLPATVLWKPEES